MGRKKAEDKEEGAYWMDTYGDMVTLLLTFFVLLFAMSSLDKDKWEIFVKAFQSKFATEDQFVIMLDPDAEEVGNEDVKPTGETPTVGNESEESIEEIDDIKKFDDLYLYLKKYFEEQNMNDSVSLTKGDGFVYVSFDNSIFFDPDDSRLLPITRQLLQVICDVTSAIPEQIGEIHAHGHTAKESLERPNNVRLDRLLSASRAAEVIIFLEENGLVTGERLKDTGHGMHMPLQPHDGTEETRKKNRRCELVIAEKDTAPPTLTEIYKMINDPEEYKDIEGLPPPISSPTKPAPPPPDPEPSSEAPVTSGAPTVSGDTPDSVAANSDVNQPQNQSGVVE